MLERTDNPVRDAENYYASLERKESEYNVEMQVTLHFSVLAADKETAKEKAKDFLTFQTEQDLELLDTDFDWCQAEKCN